MSTALQKAVDHWVRFATGTSSESEWIYYEDCPLCELYVKSSCEACPVRQATGQAYCVGSPWEEVFKYVQKIEEPWEGIKTDPEFKRLSAKEADFLQRLLNETSQKRNAK